MKKGTILRKIGWMLVGIFCLVLVPLRAGAQETQWKKHMAAAAKAHQQGNYGDAEKSFKAALEEAEHFEPQDTRLAINLHNPGPMAFSMMADDCL